MLNYLINYAIDNIWCSPSQDNQVIIKTVKISQPNGVINRFQLNWDFITLPEKYEKFHIFNISYFHPTLLNLLNIEEQWVSLVDACNNKSTILDLYNTMGIQIPKVNAWYYITKTGNILIAIKKNDNIKFDFNSDDLYIRTYCNAYYASTRSQPIEDSVFVESALINNTSKILEIQNKIAIKKTQVGLVYCFINGYRYDDINLTNTKVGDTVEYVYDGSIKTIIDFNINSLPVFDSTLDSKGKYLLHYNGNSNIIDYQDDIDLFLIKSSTGKGIYIHKNNEDTLRNITHKDYSIVTSYVHSYFDHFKDENGFVDTSDLILRFHVRNSGYNRSLIYERNKINELYKLNDTQIKETLLGINSNIDIWRAPVLEESLYVNLFRADYNQFSLDTVSEMLGYNAVAKVVGNAIHFTQTVNNVKVVKVPYLLQINSTVFEYDTNGLLLEYSYHNTGEQYTCKNTNTSFVEIIYGEASDTLDEAYENNSIVVTKNNNYRFYTCDIVNGVPTYIWQDVTDPDVFFGANNVLEGWTGLDIWGTNSITEKNNRWTNSDTMSQLTIDYSDVWSEIYSDYSLESNTVTWNNPNKYTLIRSDKKFICYQTNVEFVEGLLEVPIIYKQKRNNVFEELEITVPLGDLDVFLNGKYLIPNLDYYYDNPKIVIVNKKYLNDINQQNILIRFTGFCNKDMTTNTSGEFGFIRNGKLSDNHRFNIKDGKNQRISISGSIRPPTTVSYFEDINSGTIITSDNGKPYFLRDIVVPTTQVAKRETYSFKNESDIIDKIISDYLTTKIDQSTSAQLNVISDKHYLFSPFLSSVLINLIHDEIDISSLSQRYNEEDIRKLCLNYEHMLKYDPINVLNNTNKDYVIVHPHPFSNSVDLEFNKYVFFTKVCEVYSNGFVDLSTMIRLI